MYCSYCILQEYFDHQHQVLYDNPDDFAREVREKLKTHPEVVRFGTGEFADSLYLEKRLGLSQKIAALLEPYPQALVEFKTKSVTVAPLRTIKKPSKVVIGFSLNTPYISQITEEGTASIEARIKAAAACEAMGFWVAFHFDPMVWYPAWEDEYRSVVDTIFAHIKDPSRIAWISMGGFRTIPSLKRRLQKQQNHLPLFSGELIPGADNKYRYFKPIRVEFYSAMRQRIRAWYPECTLYLCMENDDVWKASGMKQAIPDGLTRYLDRRAEQMLGLTKRVVSS
jgi:spore photoproduct lyase